MVKSNETKILWSSLFVLQSFPLYMMSLLGEEIRRGWPRDYLGQDIEEKEDVEGGG
jgi:hypothetical protein